MKQVITRVNWLHPDRGGRSSLPVSSAYVGVAKFSHQSTEEWKKNAYSLKFEWLDTDDTTSWFGLATFLAPDGPYNWLAPGNRIDLYEGPKRVALAEIITTYRIVDGIRNLAIDS